MLQKFSDTIAIVPQPRINLAKSAIRTEAGDCPRIVLAIAMIE